MKPETITRASPETPSVLILDHEETDLELAKLYLRERGYQVSSCASVDAAEARFKRSRDTVELLVAAVSLPGASGVEFGHRMRQSSPRLKLLFTSDYSVREMSVRDVGFIRLLPPGAVRILQKPIAPPKLVAAVCDLIGPSDPVPLPAPPEPLDDAAERQRVITSLERYRKLLEFAHDAIIVRETTGRILFWNQAAESLYGWTRDQAIGQLSHKLLETAFPIPLQEIEHALLKTGSWEGELRHTIKGGERVTVSSRWATRVIHDGEQEVLEINRDISPQKRVEDGFRAINRELEFRIDQLRRAEQRFRGLLESAPDAMVILDHLGQIVLVNTQAEKQFGYTADEMLGKSLDMLVPSRFRSRHSDFLAAYLTSPDVRPMGQNPNLYGMRRNGDEFPVEIRLSPLQTEQGMLVSSTIRDISERQRLDLIAQSRNTELKKAIRARDLFLASLGSELRSPLHALNGLATVLAEEAPGPLNQDQKRCLQQMVKDTGQLLVLVDDVLDLSKIEAGQLRLQREVFDTGEAIGDVVLAIRPQLDAKSIRLAISIDGSLALYADHLRFKQVLYNLLANAVHATPAGGEIAVDATPRGDFVEIAVSDSGAGIPKEEHTSIFDRFHQPPLGLALSITRALVEQHGGRIWLTSETGHGSCFIFTFPAWSTERGDGTA
jgi:protein-histidine pros-kinase